MNILDIALAIILVALGIGLLAILLVFAYVLFKTFKDLWK